MKNIGVKNSYFQLLLKEKKSEINPAVSLGNPTYLLFSKERLSNYLQFQFYKNEFHDLQFLVFVIKLVKIRNKQILKRFLHVSTLLPPPAIGLSICVEWKHIDLQYKTIHYNNKLYSNTILSKLAFTSMNLILLFLFFGFTSSSLLLLSELGSSFCCTFFARNEWNVIYAKYNTQYSARMKKQKQNKTKNKTTNKEKIQRRKTRSKRFQKYFSPIYFLVDDEYTLSFYALLPRPCCIYFV